MGWGRGCRDACLGHGTRGEAWDVGTSVWGDVGTQDMETWGFGEVGTRGCGDVGTRGCGDVGMGFTLVEVSKTPVPGRIHLVTESCTDNLEKSTWSTLASLFSEEIGQITPRLGQFGQVPCGMKFLREFIFAKWGFFAFCRN